MNKPTSSPSAVPLVFVGALARELALFSREAGAVRLASDAGRGVLLQATSGEDEVASVLLVTAGMGASRAATAVEAALARGPVGALISVGLAGACDPGLAAGACLSAALVIDVRTGERFRTDPRLTPGARAVLATSPMLAGPAEKQRLHGAYGAAVVDMEAATVGRLARAHGIPFAAIKAISETQTVDLSHLAAFCGTRGEFQTAAFALHTLVRPHAWRAAAALGRDSKAAIAALTGAMRRLTNSHTLADLSDTSTAVQ